MRNPVLGLPSAILPILMLSTQCLLVGCATSSQKKIPDDERSALLSNMAAASLSDGDPTSAYVELDEADHLTPNDAHIQYLFALTYFQKHEPEKALIAAKRAVAIDPNFSEAKNTLGRLLMEKGDYAPAEKYLRESATDMKFRDAYVARINLGILYYKQGRLDMSEAELSRVLASEPELGCSAAYYRGQIYLQQNKLVEAQHDFETSSKNYCTGIFEARLALGKTLIKRGQTETAKAKLLEIEQTHPNSPEALEAGQILGGLP